jgi:hypothetical protein
MEGSSLVFQDVPIMILSQKLPRRASNPGTFSAPFISSPRPAPFKKSIQICGIDMELKGRFFLCSDFDNIELRAIAQIVPVDTS